MKTKLMSLAALAMVTGLIGLSIASDAAAAPAVGYIYTYYSDSTMTDEVGEKWLACSGSRGDTGTTTAYYTVETFQCDYPCTYVGGLPFCD